MLGTHRLLSILPSAASPHAALLQAPYRTPHIGDYSCAANSVFSPGTHAHAYTISLGNGGSYRSGPSVFSPLSPPLALSLSLGLSVLPPLSLPLVPSPGLHNPRRGCAAGR